MASYTSESKNSIDFEPCEFDPNTIVPHASMIIYGCRRTGKSVLCRWLLSHMVEIYDDAWIFSRTCHAQAGLFDCFHPSRMVGEFNEAKIQEIHDQQKDKVRQVVKYFRKHIGKTGAEFLTQSEKEALQKFKDKHIPRVLVVMDDVVGGADVARSNALNDLATYGRHAYISFILLSQNANSRGSISLEARNNLDLVFACSMSNEDDVKRLTAWYFCAEGRKRGMQCFRQITSSLHTFIVGQLHKKDKHTLPKLVCKVKAQLPSEYPPFQLGKIPWSAEKKKAKKRKRELLSEDPDGFLFYGDEWLQEVSLSSENVNPRKTQRDEFSNRQLNPASLHLY